MAYYSGGDPLGEDPACFFDPSRAAVSPYEEEQNKGVEKFIKQVSKFKQFKDLFG